MTKKEIQRELVLIQKGLDNFSKVLAQKKKAFKHKEKILKAFEPFSKALLKIELGDKKIKQQQLRSKPPKEPLPPVHPWRVCPYSEHWVRKHPLHVPSSKAYPEGHTVTRREHCARNPSGKDQLYPEEMKEIASQHFSNVKNKPCSVDLGFGESGSKYDDLIAGWVQYWNDVLKPDVPLDPNLIKALIASESSFDPKKLAKKKNSNSARGLMQITNETRKILDDDSGELKDHYLTVTKEDLNNPGVNICAGVRWLFQKRKLVSKGLKQPVSWLEAIWDYKGTSTASGDESEKIKKILNGYLKDLQECRKK